MVKRTATSGNSPIDLSKVGVGKVIESRAKVISSPTTDFPSSPPIDLQSKEIGSFNAEEASHQLRKEWADRILKIFRSANIAMASLLTVLVTTDVVLLVTNIIQPSDRWVTENVIVSVIGATVVQLGAATILITKSIFEKNKISP